MKQINKCPNCGGLLPKSRTNTIICEYCGSEFVNPNYDNPNEEEILYADDKVYTKVIKPFGVNEIPRFEDGTPVTSESVKKSYFCERGWDGRLHIRTFDVGMMTPHSNACNTEKIQLESGHTVSHFGNNYIVHANSPNDNMKDLMAEMKEAVLRRDNGTDGRIDESKRLPEPIEDQWRVRCYPW